MLVASAWNVFRQSFDQLMDRELPDADRERMFTSPAYVFKDGELIARDGTLLKTPTGGIHYVMPDYDRAIEQRVRAFTEANLASRFENAAISDDEICACCNGPLHQPARRDLTLHRQPFRISTVLPRKTAVIRAELILG